MDNIKECLTIVTAFKNSIVLYFTELQKDPLANFKDFELLRLIASIEAKFLNLIECIRYFNIWSNLHFYNKLVTQSGAQETKQFFIDCDKILNNRTKTGRFTFNKLENRDFCETFLFNAWSDYINNFKLNIKF